MRLLEVGYVVLVVGSILEPFQHFSFCIILLLLYEEVHKVVAVAVEHHSHGLPQAMELHPRRLDQV